MLAAGIIDPARVTRPALQNVASLARSMHTTEVMITELPEEKTAMGGMGGMYQHSIPLWSFGGIEETFVR